MTRHVGLLVVCVLICGAAAAEPLFPGAQWEVALPSAQGLDPERLANAVDYMDYAFGPDGARELAIVRNGYLVWQGPDCEAYHELRSATKVFTSTLLGLMVGDGKCTLDTSVADLLPELDDGQPAYAALTLRHLATMTGGYHGRVEGVGPGQEWGDPVVYVTHPAEPEFSPAGSQVAYNDHDVHLLGRLLATRLAGEPLLDVFQRRIAGPIGMRRWEWGVCGLVDGMVHYNAAGTPTLRGGGGVKTTPLELARLGLLYLNQGRWGDQQLLPPAFVAEATTSQVPADMTGRSRSFLSGAYGFYWWTNGVMATGKRRWPSAPPGTYTALGGSTNFLMVIPEWQIVIARLGVQPIPGNYTEQNQIWDGFLQRLGEAVTDTDRGRGHAAGRTEIAIAGPTFLLNGRPTYEGRVWQGHRIEGLLLNSRMVQGIFDDLNPETRGRWAYPDTGLWDPDRNTREFVAAMSQWRAHGLLAFTLNLQGGSPEGYSNEQPWHNSAFTATGDLRPEYMNRLERILDRADGLGIVIILGLFYFGQDQRLQDETAVVRGLDNAVDWVLDRGYRNVLIEVNNECNVRYDHAILQPERVHELMERVKSHHRNGRRLLVSTSYGGGTIPGENVVRAADFLLLHGNGVDDPERLAAMVRETRQVPGYRPMPILVNEDDHFDFDQPRNNMVAAIGEYCSWGYFDPGANDYVHGYQSPPVNWGLNTERKQAFFAKLKEVTGE